MTAITLLFLSGIGALIGWVTNLLAIKLLFRPIEPIPIPFTSIHIQGLIPKRKSDIAKSIGNIVQEELLSIDEIINEFLKNQNAEEILLLLKYKIDKIIDGRMPLFIPSPLKGVVKNYIHDIIDQEGKKMMQDTIDNMVRHTTSNIQLAKMVEHRINEFPMDKLEEIVLRIAQKELRHIEVLGGILGFIIGLVQGIIIILL